MFDEELAQTAAEKRHLTAAQAARIAREAGVRSKVAVASMDDHVDPVGACVGMKGNRVQAIVRELSNERVDIIHWTDDLTAYVKRLFAPADVKKVMPCEDNRIVVVVSTEDLSLAIGRSGQNVRLSSKLLGKEIDVYGEEDFNALSEEERGDVTKAQAR
jgi:N utilization substance protein A